LILVAFANLTDCISMVLNENGCLLQGAVAEQMDLLG
jgi:hypothetical protein